MEHALGACDDGRLARAAMQEGELAQGGATKHSLAHGTFLGARRRHPRPPRNIRALPRPPCSERSLDHYVEVGRTALMTARLARFGEIWEGKAACGASRRRGSGRGRRPRGTHPAARSSRAAWRAVESSRGRRREVDRLRPRLICGVDLAADLLPFLRLAPRRHSPRSGREAEEAPSRPSPLRTRAPSFPPTSRTEIRELARRAVTSCMQIACTISVLERARGRSHRTCCARRRRRPHG